MRTSKR